MQEEECNRCKIRAEFFYIGSAPVKCIIPEKHNPVLLLGYLHLVQWGLLCRLLCCGPRNYQGQPGGLWTSAPPLPLCFCGTDAAFAMLRAAAYKGSLESGCLTPVHANIDCRHEKLGLTNLSCLFKLLPLPCLHKVCPRKGASTEMPSNFTSIHSLPPLTIFIWLLLTLVPVFLSCRLICSLGCKPSCSV